MIKLLGDGVALNSVRHPEYSGPLPDIEISDSSLEILEIDVMIKPTVGRVVNYFPSESDWMTVRGEQPCAAIISFVINDEEVNLAVFDHDGKAHDRKGVPLKQEGGKKAPPLNASFAAWMPYQVGQAAKTEELEKQLKQEK